MSIAVKLLLGWLALSFVVGIFMGKFIAASKDNNE